MPDSGDITLLLQRMSSGDSAAEDELLPHVYTELRRIASRHLAKEHNANTLQATALVHEAYLRLSHDSAANFQNRAHFFAISSRIMRRILIENARHRGRVKRGAAAIHVPLDESVAVGEESDEIILAVHEALERLESLAPRQARIIEMRFFAGLDVAEIAEVMRISVRTVHREWTQARAWLYGELSPSN
jgi:RNA polymerase sigma factor (TIGR02999 family)